MSSRDTTSRNSPGWPAGSAVIIGTEVSHTAPAHKGDGAGPGRRRRTGASLGHVVVLVVVAIGAHHLQPRVSLGHTGACGQRDRAVEERERGHSVHRKGRTMSAHR